MLEIPFPRTSTLESCICLNRDPKIFQWMFPHKSRQRGYFSPRLGFKYFWKLNEGTEENNWSLMRKKKIPCNIDQYSVIY